MKPRPAPGALQQSSAGVPACRIAALPACRARRSRGARRPGRPCRCAAAPAFAAPQYNHTAPPCQHPLGLDARRGATAPSGANSMRFRWSHSQTLRAPEEGCCPPARRVARLAAARKIPDAGRRARLSGGGPLVCSARTLLPGAKELLPRARTLLQNGGTHLQNGGTLLQNGGTHLQNGGTLLKNDGTLLKNDGTLLQHGGTLLQNRFARASGDLFCSPAHRFSLKSSP
jgi:hypothetical protein